MIDKRQITEGLYFTTSYNKDILCVQQISGNITRCTISNGVGLTISRNELKPIPLTPEWFERLGFTLIKKDRCFNNATKSDYIEYQFELENTKILFYDGKACIISDTEQSASPSFEYVHELQLLFAAFGIYLTLNDQNPS